MRTIISAGFHPGMACIITSPANCTVCLPFLKRDESVFARYVVLDHNRDGGSEM